MELHPTLVHDPVPEGYSVATQDIVVGGKVLGQMIEVTRPGEKSKVGIQIQTGVATTAGPRRAAAKGYVNGFAGALAKAGYKVTNSKLPDITKEEFKKPITVEMNFAKDSGEQLHARLLIFFTDNGYSVQVLGDSEDTLNALHTWAKTIRAK